MPPHRPRPSGGGPLTDEEVTTALDWLTTTLADQRATRLAELTERMPPERAEQLVREEQWNAYATRHDTGTTALEIARAQQAPTTQLHADQRAAMRLLDGRPLPVPRDLEDATSTNRWRAEGVAGDLHHYRSRLDWRIQDKTRNWFRRWRYRDQVEQLQEQRAQIDQKAAEEIARQRRATARQAAIREYRLRVDDWERRHRAALQRGIAAHHELATRTDLTIAYEEP